MLRLFTKIPFKVIYRKKLQNGFKILVHNAKKFNIKIGGVAQKLN